MVKMMSIFLKFFLGKGYKTTVVKVGRIKLYNRYTCMRKKTIYIRVLIPSAVAGIH